MRVVHRVCILRGFRTNRTLDETTGKYLTGRAA